MRPDEVPWDETYTNKDGEIVKRYRLLASNAVFDNVNHHIVAKTTSPEWARENNRKRWDKHRQAAASATLKEAQSIDPTIQTEEGAWAFLVAKQYTAFLDSEKPRGDDLVRFGQVIGAMARTDETMRQPEEEAAPIVHTLSPELVDLLHQIANAQRDNADIIDAPVFDIPFPDEHKKGR